jgi:hypothetical protein
VDRQSVQELGRQWGGALARDTGSETVQEQELGRHWAGALGVKVTVMHGHIQYYSFSPQDINL